MSSSHQGDLNYRPLGSTLDPTNQNTEVGWRCYQAPCLPLCTQRSRRLSLVRRPSLGRLVLDPDTPSHQGVPTHTQDEMGRRKPASCSDPPTPSLGLDLTLEPQN